MNWPRPLLDYPSPAKAKIEKGRRGEGEKGEGQVKSQNACFSLFFLIYKEGESQKQFFLFSHLGFLYCLSFLLSHLNPPDLSTHVYAYWKPGNYSFLSTESQGMQLNGSP